MYTFTVDHKLSIYIWDNDKKGTLISSLRTIIEDVIQGIGNQIYFC